MAEYKITENIDKFIFGGNAEFTIKNEISGKGAKYHIRKKDNLYFVKVKDGVDYKYAGFLINDNAGGYKFIQGKKGSYNVDSIEVKGLMWTIAHSKKMDSRVSFIHHGRCACCGRPLDDEQSIKRGFGPVCYQFILGK